MLHSSGKFEWIQFSYDYPGTREKADLAARSEKGLMVFELKCFVKGADANKTQKWPIQLERLLQLVEKGTVIQGAALSTFFGYKDDKISEFVCRFHPRPWSYSGPLSVFGEAPLRLVLATAAREHDAVA